MTDENRSESAQDASQATEPPTIDLTPHDPVYGPHRGDAAPDEGGN